MSEFRSDHLLVRDYVTAIDHLQYSQLPDGVVCILLTHSNLPAKHVDIRLDLHMTIEEVKDKFRTHIGTHAPHQRLLLKSDGITICEMSDNSKMLGFYSVQSGHEIHVVDTDPFSLSRGGGLTDTSLIQKYKMDDEIYDKRAGTMRDFIRKQREKDPNFRIPTKAGPGKFSAATTTQKDASIDPDSDLGPCIGIESVQGIQEGMRCELTPGERRGVVKFVGEISEIKAGGYWVGVHLDEPTGSNDGSVKGSTKFECPDKYGAFVRGFNVKVGDFPERDLFDSDDDDDNHSPACNHVDKRDDELDDNDDDEF